MSQQIEAIYENGVFRPLTEVNLPEQKRVTITIPDSDLPEKTEAEAQDVDDEGDEDIEPVWRGVFPADRERDEILTFRVDIDEQKLPQRPFTIEMDWERLADE